MGSKFSELQLTYNPEARLERLALLLALGYDIKKHTLSYKYTLQLSLHDAYESGLQNSEIARRLQENLYFLEHFSLNNEDKSVDN